MKSIIVNADDFGLSPGINRGILSGFNDGILTSTTMLANLPAFDDAVDVARDNPDLPVGVHLSLLWGPPVTDAAKIPSLVDRSGDLLRSAGQLAARHYTGRLDVDEIEREFTNQIRKVKDAGLRPTHVDTHKHIHGLPLVRRALIKVVREQGIERVRLPREQGPLRKRDRTALPWKARVKRRLIGSLCRHAERELHAAGIRTTDHFVGIAHTARLDTAALAGILQSLEEGVTEIMCHPGYIDDEMRRYAGVPPHREIELAALKDARIRADIEAGAIRLSHFGDV
jgi:hopanoid biosynthesis associated protein HpnK